MFRIQRLRGQTQMLGGILSRLIILKVTEIQTTKLTSVNVEKLNFVIFRIQ